TTMKHLLFLLLFMVMLISLSFAQTPAPTPVTKAGDQPGDVWVYPREMTESLFSRIIVEIHANTGTQKLAAYGFYISFSSSLLHLEDVEEGADGFIAAVGMGSPGYFIVSGFDASGTGPGNDLHVVTLDFTGYRGKCGRAAIEVDVDKLTDEKTDDIGTPRGYGGTIDITGCMLLGDVNYDGIVDIVDALLTAQYYVGSDISINIIAGDVNCDGSTDIIDALIIAQYYVGLVNTFCS
ncbi:MAG: dockerin type I repeat-containing protein, partial [Spirochaetales bacterium]|nr:dockerin type I repeat-containing protein [Spirochaetales bacterium]